MDAERGFGSVTVKLSDIRLIEQTRYPTPTKLIVDQPPTPVPTAPVVTGQQGLLRVQWIAVSGVDGYDIAIMTTPNLAAPDINIARNVGEKNREYGYPCGNVALTRYFAVRSYLAGFFSPWTTPVSGTSLVYGAAESAPPSPPSSPPSGNEQPPSGGGGSRYLPNTL